MTDAFFSYDPEAAKSQIVDELYNRLSDVRGRLNAYKPQDQFDEGVNFALTYEQYWLEDLLNVIERS